MSDNDLLHAVAVNASEESKEQVSSETDAAAQIASLQAQLRERDALIEHLREENIKYSTRQAKDSRRINDLERELVELRYNKEVGGMLSGTVSEHSTKKGILYERTGTGDRTLDSIAELLFLIENIWKQIQSTTLNTLRPRSECVEMTPSQLLEYSTHIIRSISDQVSDCQKVQKAAGEASSSLFSLLPFSAGAMSLMTHVEPAREKPSLHLNANRRDSGNSTKSQQSGSQSMDVRASRLLFTLVQEIINQRIQLNDYTEALLAPTLKKMENFEEHHTFNGSEQAHALGGGGELELDSAAEDTADETFDDEVEL